MFIFVLVDSKSFFNVVAPEINTEILEHLFRNLPISILLDRHLRSKYTRLLLSKVIKIDIVIPSAPKLRDFISSARLFRRIFEGVTQINYAFSKSLQFILPPMEDPLFSALSLLLGSYLVIEELAFTCYEPDFPLFILETKFSSLKKLFIRYDVDWVSTQH
jgi:hypothetical protein